MVVFVNNQNDVTILERTANNFRGGVCCQNTVNWRKSEVQRYLTGPKDLVRTEIATFISSLLLLLTFEVLFISQRDKVY